jgi:hypothetical protein
VRRDYAFLAEQNHFVDDVPTGKQVATLQPNNDLVRDRAIRI